MSYTSRSGLLRNVFDNGKNRLFNAKLARVCVLFEDLRIEICGIHEPSLPALDILDPERDNWFTPERTGQYRQQYFIRRSLLTLREFAEAIRLLAPEVDLHLAFSGRDDDITAVAKTGWEAAIHFFDINERFLNDMRGDVGGHFGQPAALNALSMLSPNSCSSIATEGGDSRKLRLHFAGEIAATALLKHLPNHDIEQMGTLLNECIIPGYRHAIDCVYILVGGYLWERFG